ncbi:MAG: hypothetical protein A2600_14090 [Candidatus Lambdaproteobacteria bacterium RIFOXYD1_FULL_56_27]|uniref:Uncharacterized protein n=1 Tax=Candidatus Lambdaproteobacteria bacterium RIFOXYD2_FULL_56_26 TaxID=1817773 RepID=A0A1F6H184_9PROT|nr:MAG: hypothetical protein A2557_14125 [Candidatus Lambdaproteobacteria bacterium RIFOXYD2_FULL_56_26]OGH08267.1 MAG: hypothetical protein A2600_14090 [Candidatus Lambdaproteobacteria bacterium RIFOXYD1_FULL_56_27]
MKPLPFTNLPKALADFKRKIGQKTRGVLFPLPDPHRQKSAQVERASRVGRRINRAFLWLGVVFYAFCAFCSFALGAFFFYSYAADLGLGAIFAHPGASLTFFAFSFGGGCLGLWIAFYLSKKLKTGGNQ